MIDNPGRRDLLVAGSLAVLAGGTLAPLGAEAQPATGPAPAKELRILLLNPNSSPDFTRIIAAEARRVGSPGTEFVEVTSPFGPRYIGSRATVAIASHAAIDGLVGCWPRTSVSTLRSWPASAHRAFPRCVRS